MKLFRAMILCLLPQALVFGHSGEPLEPHDLWTAWRFDPGVIIPLILSAVLFLRGARRSHGVSAWQMFCFWTGWIALVLSLVSPLHPLGEVLFSAHMAQHEILMLIAAPLIVLSCPLVAFVWGLPFESRRVAGRVTRAPAFQRIWQAITRPSVAWCIHAIALWCWHAPVLFQATLTSEWVHTAQHLSFLLSALLFWWSLFNVRKAGGYGTGVLYVFTTAVHTSLLGALLTFAPTVWYPAYTSTAARWGLTPMEDQQIGGLIMWVPGGVVYLIAGLVLFSRWLRESDAKIGQREYAS